LIKFSIIDLTFKLSSAFVLIFERFKVFLVSSIVILYSVSSTLVVNSTLALGLEADVKIVKPA